ncbi:hypothetical protein GPX89_06300 [Nocardia sp. ET3-3]|uniref:Uncharacterized protein n=1 Tax=Nocardia terrae TaxID=2675851 RepID=A0A7K1URC4_9NOCA|nr:hypothetical protein [Nocardia terrae]MVU76857.1 hypothetical protein [Nocardia terrae]
MALFGGDIINTSTRLVAIAGCAAATALLAGCNPDTATAKPSAAQSVTTVPPGSTTPAAGRQSTGSGGGANVTLVVPGSTSIKLGGDPIPFDLTLTNPSSTDATQPLGVVVSMEHCGCDTGPTKMSPQGVMQLLDASTGTWKQVTFVREGTGMDYLSVPVIPSITLKPGHSVTYHMKVQLQADPKIDYTAGDTGIDVQLEVPGTLKGLGGTNVAVTVQP